VTISWSRSRSFAYASRDYRGFRRPSFDPWCRGRYVRANELFGRPRELRDVLCSSRVARLLTDFFFLVKVPSDDQRHHASATWPTRVLLITKGKTLYISHGFSIVYMEDTKGSPLARRPRYSCGAKGIPPYRPHAVRAHGINSSGRTSPPRPPLHLASPPARAKWTRLRSASVVW
jgi:hypothetical protein